MKIVSLMFRSIKEHYGRSMRLIFISYVLLRDLILFDEMLLLVRDQKTRNNLLNLLQMQEKGTLPAKKAAKKKH